MKYAHFIKMPKKMIDDVEFVKAWVIRNNECLFKDFSKKSHVWRDLTVQFFDQDGDNVMRGLITIKTEANLYKAPRIAAVPIPEIQKKDYIKRLLKYTTRSKRRRLNLSNLPARI
jgi:hypothetical protein